jgi:hypothetical protein
MALAREPVKKCAARKANEEQVWDGVFIVEAAMGTRRR